MRWGAPVLAVTLLIALVWASGCADVSFGSQKIGDFGSTKEEQKAVEFFKQKYGDPLTNSGSPRFLEPMVTTGLVNNTPVDKVTTFSKDTGSIFFWVFYDNFKKGDPLTLTWTFSGKTVITLQREAGGDFGRAFGEFLKPDKGWAVGTHTITISGSGTSATATFEIIDGRTQTVALPYQQVSAVSPLTKTAPAQQLMDTQTCLGPGMIICNGQCVNTISDPFNCGMCATRCPETQVCSISSCKPACDGQLTSCDRHCISLNIDRNNCGGCGNACTAIQRCERGKCVSNIANAEVERKIEDLEKAAANINKITITSPKKGDVFYWGSSILIQWDPYFCGNKTCNRINVAMFPDGLTGQVGGVNLGNTGLYIWKPNDWYNVQQSGTKQFYLKLFTPEEDYTGKSEVFTVKDNPLSAQVVAPKNIQNFITEKTTPPAVESYVIVVRYPEQGRKITQGDNVMIIWDKSNIKGYTNVKIELFREDGTFVTGIGQGFVPNTGDFEWQTNPVQVAAAGSIGPWPDPEANSIRDHPGMSYVKISTPDGKYTGNSPVFTTFAQEVPYVPPPVNVASPVAYPILPFDVTTFRLYRTSDSILGSDQYEKQYSNHFSVGYKNTEYCDIGCYQTHEINRALLKVNINGLDKDVKKATLHLHLHAYEKGGETALPDISALTSIWRMNGPYSDHFVEMARTPAAMYIGPGMNHDKIICGGTENCPWYLATSFDIDITSLVNNWIAQKKYSAETGLPYYSELLFLGPNEAQENANDKFLSEYDEISITVEQ